VHIVTAEANTRVHQQALERLSDVLSRS
jgi:hypothetical protein